MVLNSKYRRYLGDERVKWERFFGTQRGLDNYEKWIFIPFTTAIQLDIEREKNKR